MVKSLGDGALIHGDRAHRVLEVAVDAVELAPDDWIWPLHGGVNVGRVVQRDGDLFGSAVNIASRIANVAEAGEVVASRAATHAIEDDMPLEVTRAREARFKNVSSPVELFRVRRR